MPQVNWDEVQDTTPVPEGQYRVSVTKINVGVSKYNDEMWTLELTIVNGKYAGRKIVDRMTFSQAGMSRVKLICAHLGVPTKGTSLVTPDSLMHRECMLDVKVEPYVSTKDGKTYTNNKVPFAGYIEITDETKNASEEGTEDDLPF